MTFKFSNNARSTLAAAISDSDLTFSVQGGDGALFPASGNFRVMLLKATGVREIVEVESRSTDAFTIMTGGRGLEGTSAQTYSSGDVTSGVSVRLVATAGVFERFLQRLASTYKAVFNFAGLTADRTISAPDASGTLILADATQSMSAKTMIGSEFTRPKITKQTLTDGASVAWDMADGNYAVLTLGGNRTVANPTNMQDGSAVLILKQDATGSRTVTWGANFKWQAGTAPVLSTAANAVDIISFVIDGSTLYGVHARSFA